MTTPKKSYSRLVMADLNEVLREFSDDAYCLDSLAIASCDCRKLTTIVLGALTHALEGNEPADISNTLIRLSASLLIISSSIRMIADRPDNADNADSVGAHPCAPPPVGVAN